MSYFIDTKYLNMIGHRLPMFAKKKADLWNCRCVICGDSKTNKKKARGYFYRQKNDMYYKCHNCDASQHFGTFLKNFDAHTYQQYVFERYSSKVKMGLRPIEMLRNSSHSRLQYSNPSRHWMKWLFDWTNVMLTMKR